MVQEGPAEVAKDIANDVTKVPEEQSPMFLDIKPFQRKKVEGADFERRFLKEIMATMALLSEDCGVLLVDEYVKYTSNENDVTSDEKRSSSVKPPPATTVSETAIGQVSDVIAKRWKMKDEMSELTFRGLLIILEHLLSYELTNNNAFASFVEALGYHTVLFWKKAVPLLYDSDMEYGTNYRDALLFSLTLYDVNNGRNRSRELFAAVPGLRNSLMAAGAKRFGEAFHAMIQRRQGLTSGTPSAATSRRNSLCDSLSKTLPLEITTPTSEFLSACQSPRSNGSCDDDDYEVDRTLHANDEHQLRVNGAALLPPVTENGRATPLEQLFANGVVVAAANATSINGSVSDNGVVVGAGVVGGACGGVGRRRSSSSKSKLLPLPPLLMKASPRPAFDRQTSAGSSIGEASSHSGSASVAAPATPETVMTGGLVSGHFQERVINVSNAPPVQLKRGKESGAWELGQGSGGLVSCCEPVMGKDQENVWLACFGPDVRFQTTRSSISSPLPARTNCLGLPIIRPMPTEVQISMLEEPDKTDDEEAREVKDQMSLVGILRNYNKENYKLNPVMVDENDYHTYYGGISNGLLWPALHTLPDFIVKDYDDPTVLRDHWNSYVRVNYQFALNAVRKSRPQDFLWIHDYHLMLTGLIIQSLDANVEVGFFLHIPFQPPDIFFTKFKMVAEAVVRGLLRFTKVGFQTHKDRKFFVEVVQDRFPMARIHYNDKTDKHMITYEGFTTTLGVFPVSIKNEDFISVAHQPSVLENSVKIRQNVMRQRNNGGRLFFSVERFDYTKGIKEKLKAYTEYFNRYRDRVGKDVFVQVAVINRRTVETYRQYQDECQAIVEHLNNTIKCDEDPDWCPVIFLTDGLTRPNLVAHYLAMDVGVVTPEKDGMNLVAKEMIICNPRASLVISSGAGTEQQLSSAGFYSEANHCYHRVTDIHNAGEFAASLYAAAIEDASEAGSHGQKLNQFLMDNDIEKWSANFLDPSWTHEVIQVTALKTLQDFHSILFQARNVRRKVVDQVLKGHAIKPHAAISLRNVRQSLEQSLDATTSHLLLTASSGDDAKTSAEFDVSDEIRQLDIDLDFMNYVQSDSYDNLETFLQDLSKYHPLGAETFVDELDNVLTLISKGDHFDYFFSDRDGTLRSYACTYASSVQGAYSGVIQATFANRCTQYSAIVTSAPLQNIGILDVMSMPDGYFCYGASGGREWYITSSQKFKDTSIVDADLELLDLVADRIGELLEKPEFAQFAYLGSGLQRHYGHTTVARQDVYKSVDENISDLLYATVCNLVHELDPAGKRLHVSDTGTDIKILLKAKLSGQTFTKGNGIRLFAQQMKLDLSQGNILVCGDSDTDLPMLQEALLINPQNVYTVWVTANEELQQKVIDVCKSVKNSNYAFATSPFVILGAMAQATIREIKIRPSDTSKTSDDELFD